MSARTDFALLNTPPSNERPTVAVDFEGTLSNSQLYKGFLIYLQTHGRSSLARNFLLKRLHYYPIIKLELPAARRVKEQTMRDLLRIWTGVPRETFQSVIDWSVDNILIPNMRKSVLAELNAHVADGKRVVIASGMPEPFLKRVLEGLPGIEAIGTPIIYKDDVFTGEVDGPFNVQKHKVATLKPFLQAGKLAAAYGDTGEDIEMLNIAHDAVAVDPDKKLRTAATKFNWRVIEE